MTQGTVSPRKSADIIQESEFLTGSKDVGFDTNLGVSSLKLGCITMCTEMLCTNWKGQRDDTSGELAKSKTYADGNCESVTINSIFEIQRIILIGLLYLLYANLIKKIGE